MSAIAEVCVESLLSDRSTDDRDYLSMAYAFAGDSPDPSTQNGVALVAPNGVIGACNTFPPGVQSSPERLQRPLKYDVIDHAEAGAIHKAAKLGICTTGSKMYACWAACAGCARAIIAAGVKELVVHDCPAHYSRPDWQQSIEIGNQMLAEAGVTVRRVPMKIGARIRFNGEMIDV